jgi:hypothetical protein
VLDTKSQKYLEMAQGHISLSPLRFIINDSQSSADLN